MGWLRRLFAPSKRAKLTRSKTKAAALRMLRSQPSAGTVKSPAPSRALAASRAPLRLFAPGYLSRVAPGLLAGELTYAALDVETTGLDPARQRVCEIAVVRFCGNGTVLDEFATLVNPQRGIGASSDVHGISDADVVEAPTFAEVWPDVLRMLSGSVVVSHNLVFEDRFLAHELRRLGLPAPDLVGMCSLVTCRSHLAGPTYALQSVHRTATGAWVDGAHSALGDCRAIAALLPWLIATAPSPMRFHGKTPPPAGTQTVVPGRIYPRAAERGRYLHGYLGALATRFPRTSREYQINPEAALRYDTALDQVMEDHVVTSAEGAHMERLARQAGFNQQHLAAAHRAAWHRAVQELPVGQPDQLTGVQRRRLLQLAHNLGVPELATHLAVPDEADSDGGPTAPTTLLRGWRVGVDGTGSAANELRALITHHGGAIAKRLTSTVRFVAATDTDSDTAQIRAARTLNLSLLTVDQGHAETIKAISQAEEKRADALREEQRWETDRAQRKAADEAYFRHSWRPKEDPPQWEWRNSVAIIRLPTHR